jgi:DNA-binding LytR/AlgR family response regulator
MKYIILEDEQIAANRLRRLIMECRPHFKHMLSIDSVESACISLPALKPDLLFMDIQLADGLSFEILDQIQIDTPIIFTTAYDEYALRAFKTNSIDYLLKPIDPDELEEAISKFEKNTNSKKGSVEVEQLMKSLQPQGKERFVVRIGDHIKAIRSEDISLVYSEDKVTYLFTREGQRYPVDYSVEKIDTLLDPRQFKKISRKHIIHIDAIKDIVAYTNSRLELFIEKYKGERVIVAREKVQDFKNWLDR